MCVCFVLFCFEFIASHSKFNRLKVCVVKSIVFVA